MKSKGPMSWLTTTTAVTSVASCGPYQNSAATRDARPSVTPACVTNAIQYVSVCSGGAFPKWPPSRVPATMPTRRSANVRVAAGSEPTREPSWSAAPVSVKKAR